MLFYYRRIEGLDENKPRETQFRDCFNINDVLRGSWKDSDYFIIELNDGHEESRFTTMPTRNKAGKLIGGEKSRVQITTYLALNKTDADRLRSIAGIGEEIEDVFIPQTENLKPWNDNPVEKSGLPNETVGDQAEVNPQQGELTGEVINY